MIARRDIERLIRTAERRGEAAALDLLADLEDGARDAARALRDDPTGQDDSDPATTAGCGADDTYDKSGRRRLSRFNDGGEPRW